MSISPWKCRVGRIVHSLLCVAVVLLSPVKSQDVGSFLAGLLGAADVPTQSSNNDNSSSQNPPPCPGECVHALTSILCSRVIEQFDCGASYLRCCVGSDFNFGTVVETSAPLPEDSSTEATQYEVFLVSTTDPSPHELTTNHIDQSSSSPGRQTPAPPGRQTPAPPGRPTPAPPKTRFSPPCTGICVENIFVRYCSATMPDMYCEPGSTCCVSHGDDEEEGSSLETTTISIPISWTSHEEERTTQAASTTTTLPSPACPGSCVAPLFSLLCDTVNPDFYCPNDGRCCISSEEQTPTTTTTVPPRPQGGAACPGACIPMFLRGMCNRPSEITLQSDCDQDFVCCYQPDLKDHAESPHIPLVRPPSHPPVRQQYPPPPHVGYHPQRPPYNNNPKPVPPVIISNSHAPPNSNVYGTNQPGYIPLPHPHGNNGMYGRPHPPNNNNNYGYEPPPQRPITPYNSSGDTRPPTRFTVPEQPHVPPPKRDHVISLTHDKRRHNISIAPPPETQSFDQVFVPPEIHHESSRLVPSKPVSDASKRPDQVVSASIGFNNPRPVDHPKTPVDRPADRIHKPPQHERFRPLPNRFPHSPGIQDTAIPDTSKPSGDTSVAESLERPHAFIPVQESFRPIQNQQRPPSRPPHTTPSSIHPIHTTPFSIHTTTPTTLRPVQTTPTPVHTTQSPPIRPLRPVAALSPDTEETMVVIPAKNESSAAMDHAPKKPMPVECPGSCIGSFLRFTCFGNSAIYNGFRCEPEGTLCCTSVEYIEKYEEHLKSGGPLVLVKPDEAHKEEMSSTSVRRPGMYVCGIKGNQRRKTGRVVGGKTSAPGEWCWQVALINSKNQYLCGGALIGSRWVLTAAHCITALVRNGDAIFARVGDYDLSSQYGSPGAQTQKVSTSYIHHNHNGQTLDNDIALLRLEQPVQLQESVCLACLPARGAESRPGKRCTVTGYGYMTESGPIALKIREAVLPIVEEQLCTEQINKVTEKRFLLPTGSFCAGGEPENDACQGDGGGPLTCENEGYHELTGLVSWGFGCGKENVPGVYVKVSSYIGWINQIISVNN